MLTASFQHPNTEDSSKTELSTPTPQNWCGVVKGLEQARLYMAAGQDQLAIDSLKEVLEFAPSESEAWYVLADILLKHGMVEKSGLCLQNASRFKQSPTTSEIPASIRLAKILWSQGDHTSAESMLYTLLEVQPNDEKALALQQTWQSEKRSEKGVAT